jgi:hypothetical protein
MEQVNQLEDISVLTVQELRDLLRGRLHIPREANSRKDDLVKYVRAHASEDDKHLLQMAARERVGFEAGEKWDRKRKRTEYIQTRRVAKKTEEVYENETHDINRYSILLWYCGNGLTRICVRNSFLQLPTAGERKALYRKYYVATSNAAVATMVCGVCAREFDVCRNQMAVEALEHIPNSHRLVPQVSHPAHDLFLGKLLEPSGLMCEGDTVKVYVCSECLTSLRNSRDIPPPHSLANNLWIGRTPWELQVLTFPEQLLVALLYPRV